MELEEKFLQGHLNGPQNQWGKGKKIGWHPDYKQRESRSEQRPFLGKACLYAGVDTRFSECEPSLTSQKGHLG